MEHGFGINIRDAPAFIVSVQKGHECELWVCQDSDFAIADIVKKLRDQGKKVTLAIHPVAGGYCARSDPWSAA